MPVTLTPFGLLNGPNISFCPGLSEKPISSQPLVLVLVRYQTAVPDAASAVRAPTQTHLFSLSTTEPLVVMLDATLGTMIAIADLAYSIANDGGTQGRQRDSP